MKQLNELEINDLHKKTLEYVKDALEHYENFIKLGGIPDQKMIDGVNLLKELWGDELNA